jgi:hypothetical protein
MIHEPAGDPTSTSAGFSMRHGLRLSTISAAMASCIGAAEDQKLQIALSGSKEQ